MKKFILIFSLIILLSFCSCNLNNPSQSDDEEEILILDEAKYQNNMYSTAHLYYYDQGIHLKILDKLENNDIFWGSAIMLMSEEVRDLILKLGSFYKIEIIDGYFSKDDSEIIEFTWLKQLLDQVEREKSSFELESANGEYKDIFPKYYSDIYSNISFDEYLELTCSTFDAFIWLPNDVDAFNIYDEFLYNSQEWNFRFPYWIFPEDVDSSIDVYHFISTYSSFSPSITLNTDLMFMNVMNYVIDNNLNIELGGSKENIFELWDANSTAYSINNNIASMIPVINNKITLANLSEKEKEELHIFDVPSLYIPKDYNQEIINKNFEMTYDEYTEIVSFLRELSEYDKELTISDFLNKLYYIRCFAYSSGCCCNEKAFILSYYDLYVKKFKSSSDI